MADLEAVYAEICWIVVEMWVAILAMNRMVPVVGLLDFAVAVVVVAARCLFTMLLAQA